MSDGAADGKNTPEQKKNNDRLRADPLALPGQELWRLPNEEHVPRLKKKPEHRAQPQSGAAQGKARELLKSDEGIKKRKRRCYDVEAVFAHMKHAHQFRRFTLKSLKKVEIEFGLHALAHNLRKKVA